jgi:hypothetical protein
MAWVSGTGKKATGSELPIWSGVRTTPVGLSCKARSPAACGGQGFNPIDTGSGICGVRAAAGAEGCCAC